MGAHAGGEIVLDLDGVRFLDSSESSERAALGIGRVGSYAAHGSGEIILAFSTANKIPRTTQKMIYHMKILLDQRLNPLYEAAIEATEEAILNSLCMAREMEGANGNFAPALPNWVAGFAGIVGFGTLFFGRVGREEQMMLETFGDDYRQYMSKTCRVIPFIF